MRVCVCTVIIIFTHHGSFVVWQEELEAKTSETHGMQLELSELRKSLQEMDALRADFAAALGMQSGLRDELHVGRNALQGKIRDLADEIKSFSETCLRQNDAIHAILKHAAAISTATDEEGEEGAGNNGKRQRCE